MANHIADQSINICIVLSFHMPLAIFNSEH
jgi:hypothetical protein